MKEQKGLTLIELIISVSILVVLVGIAFPSYRLIYIQSKVSEAMRNLDGIRLYEESYRVENDEYYDCAQSPIADDAITSTPVAWVDNGTPGVNAFIDIGYQPKGEVRYSYLVKNSSGTGFRAEAHGDLDDDDNISIYSLSQASLERPVHSGDNL